MLNVIRAKHTTWVDIKGPTEKDLEWLEGNFTFHPLVLKELMPQLDYPKIEQFGRYLFLVLFYPFYDARNFRTVPLELDIIVAKNYIITNHYKDIVPLKAIFDKCNLYEDIREEYTKKGTHDLLYRIVNEVLQASFPKLSHIKQNLDELESAIYSEQYKESVQRISLIRRDIIGFQRIIEPQGLVLNSLIEKADSFFDIEITPYLHSLLNSHNQINTILKTQTKTLDALDATNQSLIDTRTNTIMKALTIFLVLLYPFSFFSDIFSMTGQFLKFTLQPRYFWLVYGVMFAGFFTILAVLKKKKWL
ncbi:MAG: CorA family divalent cation transporter [Candidatus Pacebacteria bacterium]|nr:CorA family divalent cation transporter [Candidatus Paceibacterota bacterium]